MWQFIDFRLLAEKMWKIHWKQFVTLLIEQIQSKHNKNMITACHNNDIIFFLLSRDIRFFKKGHQKRPMGQTRWPSIFSSLGVIWSHKKQTKLEYFVILRILIFQCPGTTHITNFTRMPQYIQYTTGNLLEVLYKTDLSLLTKFLIQWNIHLNPFPSAFWYICFEIKFYFWLIWLIFLIQTILLVFGNLFGRPAPRVFMPCLAWNGGIIQP